jgi:hypothetical protein
MLELKSLSDTLFWFDFYFYFTVNLKPFTYYLTLKGGTYVTEFMKYAYEKLILSSSWFMS